MKCTVCRQGETESGMTTVTLERAGTTLVFKNVPAEVCVNCGEKYVSGDITTLLLEKAEAAVNEGVKVDIREFRAA